MNENGLIYGLEERPPLKDTLFAALQHLLAIFVAIITPPLIVAGALGLDIQTTSYLVSMSLFVSGIATFIQCRKVGAMTEVFISRILKYAMKIITPLVSGIVVTLIGMSLIKVGITSCGGGTAALENGTFGLREESSQTA